MPFLSFKAIAIGLIVLALLASGAYALHAYGDMVIAKFQASQEKAAADAAAANTARVNDAVDQIATAAAARIQSTQQVKVIIHAAQAAPTFSYPPRIRAVLDSLRGPPGGGGGSAPASP